MNLRTEIWTRKGIAAGITVGFLALVSTTEQPPLWIVAAIAVGLYECNLAAVREIWRIRKIRREVNRNLMGRYSLARWADEWIRYPMKEVS